MQEGVLAALMEGKPVPPSNRRTPDCRRAPALNAHLGRSPQGVGCPVLF